MTPFDFSTSLIATSEMTPYEFCESYIAATRKGEPFGWMLEDIHKLTLSHQRMYSLIKEIAELGAKPQSLEQRAKEIVAEMEPSK